MARPKLENGYSPIANEILEALAKVNISPGETRILNTIIRNSYGWKRKEAKLSLNDFEKATGINKKHLNRYIGGGKDTNGLIEKKMINRITRTGDKKPSYSIQKDYEKWETSPELVTKITKIGDNRVKTSPELVTNITKTGDLKSLYPLQEADFKRSKSVLNQYYLKQAINSYSLFLLTQFQKKGNLVAENLTLRYLVDNLGYKSEIAIAAIAEKGCEFVLEMIDRMEYVAHNYPEQIKDEGRWLTGALFSEKGYKGHRNYKPPWKRLELHLESMKVRQVINKQLGEKNENNENRESN